MNAKKRVIFCTYASVYSSKVLQQLIEDDSIDVVAIINSTRVIRSSLNLMQGAITQLKISGLAYSSYLFMMTDFFSLIQPFLYFKKNALMNVHRLAKANGIQVINTRDINSIKDIQFIENKKADFLLCAHFNQLLKEPILTIKGLQCINIHPSLLPDYKGVDPVFFAMKDNTNELGVTLHEMDESFDTGNIIFQSMMTRVKEQSLFINNCRLFEVGATLAMKFMKNEASMIHIPEKKNQVHSYDSWPTNNDVNNFKKTGGKLITPRDLWDQI